MRKPAIDFPLMLAEEGTILYRRNNLTCKETKSFIVFTHLLRIVVGLTTITTSSLLPHTVSSNSFMLSLEHHPPQVRQNISILYPRPSEMKNVYFFLFVDLRALEYFPPVSLRPTPNKIPDDGENIKIST